MMRLAFMGTPDFAVPTLESLLDAGHEVVVVYTQPPRPAGRGKKERKSPVHSFAEKAGLRVVTPKSMKVPEELAAFEAFDLDAAVVVAYGQILPQAILDTPKHGCVNVHASLLPRWRGAAPIHRAIMAGDSETGVCIMQMEAGLDTGPVISSSSITIADTDTTASLHDRLADLGAGLINTALLSLADGEASPEAQPKEGVTYAHKIDKSEARINWTRAAEEIDRQVRGLFPFPGAWTEIAGERIKVLAGTVKPGQHGKPAVCLDDRLTIACGKGAYAVEKAQRAGKAASMREDLLRGFPVPAGTVVE